jgi:hypothetical protein
MAVETLEQLGWCYCRVCHRTTRFGRSRAIWPTSAPPWWLWLCLRAHNLVNPWRCLEHRRETHSGPITSFEPMSPGGPLA